MSRMLSRNLGVLAVLAALGVAEPVGAQPSPLDKLSAADIPKEERTAWLPPEVVAVLGSQRGRHWSSIEGMTRTRDGKRLLSWGRDGIRLWDADTLQELAHVHKSGDYIFGVALSPDERVMAASG